MIRGVLKKPAKKGKAKEPEEPAPFRHKLLYDLDRIFLIFFDKMGAGLVRAFELDKAIAAGMIRIHPIVYGARAVGFTFMATLVGVALASLGLLFRDIMTIVLLITIGALLPVTTLTFFITYPVVARNTRKNLTESELPFFASYLSIMARGGVPIARAMESFRRNPLFAGLRMEARELFRRMRLFGRDPLTALEEVASYHPSQAFKDFIMGYAATLRSGGDIVRYLETRVDEYFRRQEEIIKRMVQKLGVFIEIYMLIAVIGGIGMLLLFTSSGGLQTVGATPAVSFTRGFDPTISILFNFIGLPILTLIMIYAAHSAQPRWGIGIPEIRLTAIMMGILSPLAYLTVILGFAGYEVFAGSYSKQAVIGQILGLSAALLTVSIPAWVVYGRAVKGVRELERQAASYIESVSELRRTGLSPEKAFIEASKRDFGPFTPIAKRIAIFIEIGVDIEEAVRRSLYNVRSWLLSVIFRFVVDSVKVGGGNPEIFYMLARYSTFISEAYERLKKDLRLYIIMPYIGALLFAITSIVYLSFIIAQPLSGGGHGILSNINLVDPATIYRLALTSSLAAVINAWLMGLVAGKISGLSIGEGFKHATIITLITAAMVVVFTILFLP